MKEQDILSLFEDYASRKGYNLERDEEWNFFYKEERTEEAWRMFHVGFVRAQEIYETVAPEHQE